MVSSVIPGLLSDGVAGRPYPQCDVREPATSPIRYFFGGVVGGYCG
jgi:hypothetical protein